jgi:hypothetical protein
MLRIDHCRSFGFIIERHSLTVDDSWKRFENLWKSIRESLKETFENFQKGRIFKKDRREFAERTSKYRLKINSIILERNTRGSYKSTIKDPSSNCHSRIHEIVKLTIENTLKWTTENPLKNTTADPLKRAFEDPLKVQRRSFQTDNRSCLKLAKEHPRKGHSRILGRDNGEAFKLTIKEPLIKQWRILREGQSTNRQMVKRACSKLTVEDPRKLYSRILERHTWELFKLAMEDPSNKNSRLFQINVRGTFKGQSTILQSQCKLNDLLKTKRQLTIRSSFC